MNFWLAFSIGFLFIFIALILFVMVPIMIILDCYTSDMDKKSKSIWIPIMVLFFPACFLYAFTYSKSHFYTKASVVMMILLVILGTFIHLSPLLNLKPHILY